MAVPSISPKAPHLSPQDMAVYRAVVQYKQENDGCSPNTRALMEACHLASSSGPNYHLARLERAGLIERGRGACQIRVKGGRWLPGEA